MDAAHLGGVGWAAGPPRQSPCIQPHGQLLGIADGLDDESATVLEYDGAGHRAPDHAAADTDRDERFSAHGLRTLRVTKDDLTGAMRDQLIGRMRDLRATGLARDLDDDRWTMERPDGWQMPGWDPTRRD